MAWPPGTAPPFGFCTDCPDGTCLEEGMYVDCGVRGNGEDGVRGQGDQRSSAQVRTLPADGDSCGGAEAQYTLPAEEPLAGCAYGLMKTSSDSRREQQNCRGPSTVPEDEVTYVAPGCPPLEYFLEHPCYKYQNF